MWIKFTKTIRKKYVKIFLMKQKISTISKSETMLKITNSIRNGELLLFGKMTASFTPNPNNKAALLQMKKMFIKQTF